MADWFSSFATNAMKFADDLADSLVTQANEAQAQLQEEKFKLEKEEFQRQQIVNGRMLLPWETTVESRQILSMSLMETIMGLSVHEKNFIIKAGNADDVNFSFEDFVPTALKLLELDANLARMHAKLSPKMNEELFWFNYFCRIVYLRAISGIDGVEAQKAAEKYKKQDIVFDASNVLLDQPAVHQTNTNNTQTTNTQQKASSSSSSTLKTDTLIKASVLKKSETSSSPPSSSSGSTVMVSSSPFQNNKSSSNTNTIVTAKTKADKDLEDELDLKDLNLDDLDDLKDLELMEELNDVDPSDYEKIGSSECNDELEAQIAQELAEYTK